MRTSDLRHRLLLSSQRDAVVNGTFYLNRKAVTAMWAKVEAKAASTWSKQGATVKEPEAKRTHIITTRYHRELDVTNMAWFYEERRKSADRWFKILAVNQTEKAGVEYFMFDCRLVERGDTLVKPKTEEDDKREAANVAAGLPAGVKL